MTLNTHMQYSIHGNFYKTRPEVHATQLRYEFRLPYKSFYTCGFYKRRYLCNPTQLREMHIDVSIHQND
ncbi:unnamed protein product [Allacma fusca]|uniref:Uncharacterized protein n=1 Tax=Allacma fusca TaxID=39272 RepID=A0A8J2K9J0_9HEXA|nr:unnamed protein product [Allacma fusca]